MGNIGAANRVPGTAAAAVEGAATTRALDKLSNVEKAAREVATRMLALCQQFLDAGRAIRIAGPEATSWLQVTDTDIEGEFAIDVEGGSTSAINPATRARQGVEMLQNIIPTLTNLGYNPEPALRQALSYMGLNPDNILVKPEVAPAPPSMSPEGQMAPQQAPEAGMTPSTGPEATAGMPTEGAGPMSDSEIIAQLQNMGGTPMPGAQDGGIL